MFHQSLSISFCFLDSKPPRAFFYSLIDWDNWSADWRQCYYFLFVSLAQREARRPDTACQFGCALMIPPINCPGLVRHLHSVYCSFCVPVTDIYRSACKENISIFAEGEPSIVVKCNNKQSLKSYSLWFAFVFFGDDLWFWWFKLNLYNLV